MTEINKNPKVSVTPFLVFGGSVFSIGILYGINRALKEEENERRALRNRNSAFNGLLSLRTMSNQSGIRLATRALGLGTLLCFSSFTLVCGIVMIANNLYTLPELDQHIRRRILQTPLGKLVDKPLPPSPANEKEAESLNKWLQENVLQPAKEDLKKIKAVEKKEGEDGQRIVPRRKRRGHRLCSFMINR